MSCGVKNCCSSDDRFLWKCEFCYRKYHAACVGVQRTRELFITAFMLPVCADCQEILRKETDVKKLLYQQEQLVEAIRGQTDTNQRIAADLKKFHIITELFDSIEHLMNDVKESLTNVNKTNKNSFSAISTHMKSCDSQMHTTINGIMEANAKSQKLNKSIDERLSFLSNTISRNLEEGQLQRDHLSPRLNNESTLQEILGEVKIIFEAVSDLQKATPDLASKQLKTLADELSTTSYNDTTIQETETGHKENEHTSPGWRFLGNKWRWMPDWSAFDKKQRTRRQQEKAAEKARRNKKRRKQQHNCKYNNNINNSNQYNNRHNNQYRNNNNNNLQHPPHQRQSNNIHNTNGKNNNIRAMATDKHLLAAAKVQFAGPPSTTDHPIAGLSVPKFIDFKKGEIINPYRPDHQPLHDNNQSSSSVNNDNNSTPGWSLDPMRPTIVNLTQQSADGDRRFLKARLRDPKIMYIVRLYLAYMHDKGPSFCHDGLTPTSLRMNLASEGLPTAAEELRKIFLEVHNEFGVPKQAALDDLDSYNRHLSNQRIHQLQLTRESNDRFRNPYFRK